MESPKLDEDQQKAVEHLEGPALVVAGPGSGKTTVIKERILHLIREHNVDPEHILAIAFTNAAADEMTERLSNEPLLSQGKPKICTLHVFGKDLIKTHYKEAGFAHEPNNIWDDKKIGQIIYREKSRLEGENEDKPVAIYKIEDKTTYQCYIGQTINPNRRKKEHFNHSSNRRLREAIQLKGEKAFDFTYEWVAGIETDREETYRINSYRNRAAINLSKGDEQIDKENSNIPITVYKIESPNAVTCYFGQTIDLGSIDKPEGFEIIGEEETWDEASERIELEIEKHKNWAVFNEEDPLYARDSTRRRIEVFCKYFNASYNEVLEHTQKFEHEMRIFDGMNDDIIKEKSKVYTERFEPEKINDPVLRAFAKRYEDHKTEARALDFLDMLILSANMLEKNQDLLREYREKHCFVFVDEFQDISPIDFRLIDLFSENLFAVGDDDQAIYGFRGGDSSIMQKKFGKRENVSHYEITRNYRSTSKIVRHAKALIEHNSDRMDKNLRANNSAQSQVDILGIPKGTVKEALLNELFNVLKTDLQKIGILARNWRGEINKIQGILKSSELDKQGFEISWEKLDDDLWKQSDESDKKNRRKMILRRGRKEIEILNIHTAKGKEWDKVILLVNTMYNSLPDRREDPTEERRLFYVAVTRAKQELVVLDGGNCQFISEFQNAPPTKEEWEEVFRTELATQEPKFTKELGEASETALIALESRLKKELEEASKVARKQNETNISRLRCVVAETENAKQNVQQQIIEKLPQQLKNLNDTLLEDLIPVLDAFESQINSLPATTESNNEAGDFVELTKSVQLVKGQFLDLFKSHGLKPIETVGEIFNPDCHEEILPPVYSDEVPAASVAKEEQCGYLLHDRVIRKAQVVVSKGRVLWTPERLDRIIGRYIDRLMFGFQDKYRLDNINKAFIKLKMVQHMMELDNEAVGEIDAFAIMDERPGGRPELYANYCVGPEKTHLCTPIFRNFWNRMWEVVEQSRKNPGTKIALPLKSESFKDEPDQSPINKPIPILKIEIEKPQELLTVRNIERMSKTVEPRPRTNGLLLVSKVKRVSLDKSVSAIVRKSVEEMIDIPPPISTDLTESLDTYARDLKPEILKTVEVQSDLLYKPIDFPKPAKELVDSQIPTPKNSSRVPNLQTQALTPEPPRIEIDPDPLATVNSNADSTLPVDEDIFRKQIQNLRPDTFEPDIVTYPPIALDNRTQEIPQRHEDILQEQVQDLIPDIAAPENPDNVTQQPTSETDVDRETPVESIVLTRPDSSAEIDSDTRQIKAQDSSENMVENRKKSFGDYLSQGGRFVVEKIKVIIFRKPSS